jgi:uncharacterized protein (TIGR00297 family)
VGGPGDCRMGLGRLQTVLAAISLPELIAGLLLSVGVAIAGYRRNALDESGMAGGILTGTLTFGLGGWEWGVLLIAFFVSSSVLSFVGTQTKARLAGRFSKGHRRDLGQALANGGVPALLAIASLLWPHPAWFAACAGALSAANADTWATEIGVLSSRVPRLITTGVQVDPGTSGAVSRLGTAASLVGALLIGVLAALGALVQGAPFSAAIGLLAAATVGGAIGSLVDSLLGASVQAVYWCSACGRETESRVHHCGARTLPLRGSRHIGNDLVNFIASLLGAAAAAGVYVSIL